MLTFHLMRQSYRARVGSQEPREKSWDACDILSDKNLSAPRLPVTESNTLVVKKQQSSSLPTIKKHKFLEDIVMNSWFGNISVNMKLGLGFGLVLALTCVLALTGWTSLGGLIDRSNWMSDITQLNSSLTKLRIVRLQYMLANGDETARRMCRHPRRLRAQQQNLISAQEPGNVKCSRRQRRPSRYQTP